MSLKAQFGASLRKKDVEKFKASLTWKNNKFHNLSPTLMGFSLGNLPEMLKDNFSIRQIRMPKKALPIKPFAPDQFHNDDRKPKFVWYGHSVLLLQLAGKNILIDPMFGDDASPIAPIKTKRFSDSTMDIIDTLPQIDAILITHDHYDHLDLNSIKKLIPLVDQWFVALGVARHLSKWGLNESHITELDWWDQVDFNGIQMTYTPSRHFAGRGAFDRAQSLWGGFVFQTADHTIYHSGDGGYDDHFKEIGDKYGPFDLMFVECGQYYKHWPQIHLFPEQSIQAGLDAKAKVLVPIHWGGFALAPHHWKDPIQRFVQAAKEHGQAIFTPSLGAIWTLDDLGTPNNWWENHD
ncbi:hypothetical protein DN752_19385 [Echinicola strongylocentroti]|uniref:Metallo-beta-lactamase domain-containing protein n=1 Tax=Echinicola strongylocentroti TaxID=1795355 RepID=A0A2Z4IN16_9BACT|nr:MBL fold metallo-hydrolase [Echinicola strongylocentroti]AWW32127.1 hypothetical protein DN752_19385 [Echinicola strongylocentroti]